MLYSNDLTSSRGHQWVRCKLNIKQRHQHCSHQPENVIYEVWIRTCSDLNWTPWITRSKWLTFGQSFNWWHLLIIIIIITIHMHNILYLDTSFTHSTYTYTMCTHVHIPRRHMHKHHTRVHNVDKLTHQWVECKRVSEWNCEWVHVMWVSECQWASGMWVSEWVSVRANERVYEL